MSRRRPAGRPLGALGVGVLPLLAGLATPASAAVKVFFPRGEQVVAVPRPGSTAEDAVRALLRGPTPAERRLGPHLGRPTSSSRAAPCWRRVETSRWHRPRSPPRTARTWTSACPSTGADLVTTTIRPVRTPLLPGSVTVLTRGLRNGRCEAVVYDAPSLATLRTRVPSRYGPFAGVIRTGES